MTTKLQPSDSKYNKQPLWTEEHDSLDLPTMSMREIMREGSFQQGVDLQLNDKQEVVDQCLYFYACKLVTNWDSAKANEDWYTSVPEIIIGKAGEPMARLDSSDIPPRLMTHMKWQAGLQAIADDLIWSREQKRDAQRSAIESARPSEYVPKYIKGHSYATKKEESK